MQSILDFYSVPIVDQSSGTVGNSTVTITKYDLGSAHRYSLQVSSANLLLNLGSIEAIVGAALWSAITFAVVALVVASRIKEDHEKAINDESMRKGEWVQKEAERLKVIESLSIWGEMPVALHSMWCWGLAACVFVGFVAIAGPEYARERLMQKQARADRGLGSWGGPRLRMVQAEGWFAFRANLTRI